MRDLEPLPSWVDPARLETQKHIVSDIVDRFRGRNGYPESDLTFLQAPTGVGKSIIAELVSRELNAKTIYSCTTKLLQDQFAKDFPYAQVLKGRSNYLTQLGLVDEMGRAVDYITDAVTAHDCTWNPDNHICQWCDARAECPYVRAKGRALSARLAVLNTSYLLTDSGGPGQFLNRDLYILDEADLLEGELLNHAELHLTNGRMRKLGLTYPKYKTKDDTWAEWIAKEALPRAREYNTTLPFLADAKTTKMVREIKYMERLTEQLRKVMAALPQGKWIYDGYKDKDKGAAQDGDVIFRPVFLKSYGRDLLWGNGRKFLVMSATILSGDVMADELGVPGDRPYDLIDVPSNFPPENRPVHVVPMADVTAANAQTERPKLAKAINGVLLRHKDERILIHCVSYDLADYLHTAIVTGESTHNRPLISYRNSFEKTQALAEYINNPSSVLFAPSMDRGVDLPDDLCRIQVIAKVPWPNKGDKRTNARLHLSGGGDWYNMHAIRTIIQMAGRAVRHREDYAVTYIFDEQFLKLWNSNKSMFPKYFREALNFRFNPRLLTERV